jgi:nucleotide-binding universal stress UspA family protein
MHVVWPAQPTAVRTILVPLDGSLLARAALAPSLAVAERMGAQVVVAHVAAPGQGARASPTPAAQAMLHAAAVDGSPGGALALASAVPLART